MIKYSRENQMHSFDDLIEEINILKDPERAKASAWFFKTGKGEYGEGDIFIGITVPRQRKLAKKYKALEFDDIKKLLNSKIHEERLIAVFILVNRFQKGSLSEKKEIFDFYLASTKYINNWDLVDSSAGYIVGNYLLDKNRDMFIKLARSENLWERRIAMIATSAFINRGESEWTFK